MVWAMRVGRGEIQDDWFVPISLRVKQYLVMANVRSAPFRANTGGFFKPRSVATWPLHDIAIINSVWCLHTRGGSGLEPYIVRYSWCAHHRGRNKGVVLG